MAENIGHTWDQSLFQDQICGDAAPSGSGGQPFGVVENTSFVLAKIFNGGRPVISPKSGESMCHFMPTATSR
jgi:hypothetical protein